jgi:hypothetical protein
MALWRWLRDPAMGFPQPVYFGRLRFWRLNVLERWERGEEISTPRRRSERLVEKTRSTKHQNEGLEK